MKVISYTFVKGQPCMEKTKRQFISAYIEQADLIEGYNISQLSDKAPVQIIPTIEMMPNGLIITLGSSTYFFSHLSSIEFSSTLAEAMMSYALAMKDKKKDDD